MPLIFSLPALKERFVMAIAVRFSATISRHQLQPRRIGGAPARIDRADARADLAERRLLRGDGQIAHGRQHVCRWTSLSPNAIGKPRARKPNPNAGRPT